MLSHTVAATFSGGNENNATATAAKKRFEMLKTSNHHKRSRTVKAAINFLLTALGPSSVELSLSLLTCARNLLKTSCYALKTI
jgi:hypothetical protein